MPLEVECVPTVHVHHVGTGELRCHHFFRKSSFRLVPVNCIQKCPRDKKRVLTDCEEAELPLSDAERVDLRRLILVDGCCRFHSVFVVAIVSAIAVWMRMSHVTEHS